MMTSAGIYMLVNKVTGKRYVGSSRNCARRKSEHISRLRRGAHINKKLQAAWNKYGEDAFEFVVAFSVLNVDQIETIEQQFLDEMQAVATGYNLAPVAGNTAGWKAPPETRKRMSDAAKKRDHTVQVRRMAEATRGKKRPRYVIEAMQAGRKANPINEQTRAQMSASAKARGCTSSPEHLERLRLMAIARARFSIDQMREMAALKDEGLTLKQIGARFGITAESTVSMYVRKARAC